MSDIELLAFGFCTAFFVVILKSIVQTLVESWSKKEWVGLNSEDMNDEKTHNFDFIHGARWAEEILKERNK
jgi:hypothetical protein